MADRLCVKSEGNFLYVQQALDGVERNEHPLARLDALPPGLAGLYLLRFEKQFPDGEIRGDRGLADPALAENHDLFDHARALSKREKESS